MLKVLYTAIFVGLAAISGVSIWDYYLESPWTRDGRVSVDVVGVTPDVSGLVTEVVIKDNQLVKRGDVIFRIDPDRFRLAVRQAEAIVAQRQAIMLQTADDYERYRQLSDSAVSHQKLELTRAAAQQAQGALEQSIADRELAQLNLARSEVRAPVDGRITNMTLLPGAYVSVGHGVMALIAESTLRVEGYFEETKLARIHVGDRAAIHLMGETTSVAGHVESIAGGIEDRERTPGPNLMANVNPTFSWVRLAQRVPVRVALDDVPSSVSLIAGRTVTVSIASAR
jgi:RND family efflux transporter MFP subunit